MVIREGGQMELSNTFLSSTHFTHTIPILGKSYRLKPFRGSLKGEQMKVKIDDNGWIAIWRHGTWRVQQCQKARSVPTACCDKCPFFYELENNKVDFACGYYPHGTHDLIEDERKEGYP